MFARMVWASLRRRRARLTMALLAVTLGVAVAIALAGLALQVGDDLARTLRAAGPNFVVLPAGARWPVDLGGAELEPPRAGAALGDSTLVRLKLGFWKNNVLEAAPEAEARLGLDGAPAVVLGTWFDREVVVGDERWRTGVARLRAGWALEGAWPRDDANEIALGAALARRRGLAPGDHVTLAGGGDSALVRVTGIVAADPRHDARAWAPLALVQRLAGRPHESDRVWLSALVRAPARRPPPDPKEDPVGYERHLCTNYPEVVAKDLQNNVPRSEVLAMTEIVAGEGAIVGRLNVLMVLLALAALTASVLGLLSTSAATVVERAAELGLLRAIGAAPRQIAALLLGETLLVSAAGGVLGWALGIAAARAIRGDTFGAAAAFSPLLLPLALVLALVVAALGTLGPLRMALRVDPTVALRG